MTARKTDLSIVIPVYRAEDCLKALHERLTATLKTLVPAYEIIFVEDCGPDNSWTVLTGLASQDANVKCYRLSRNFGQHAAITAGLSQCRGERVIVMDCDLQDPPEVIPALYQKSLEGYDVVLAKRKGKRHSLYRRLSANIYFKVLNMLTGRNMNGEYGSFSLISRKVADAYLKIEDRNRHYLLILYWLGFKTADIEYNQAERFSGESSYTLKTLIRHALRGIFFQTTVLLQWIIYLGLISSISGLLFAAHLVYQYYINSALPGWTSLAVLILVMSGLILMSLGVVGGYIGQIFEQVQGRPIFIVDQSQPGE
jgi:glycosyltransferase involved in cell wall biosynthesis